MGKLNSCLYILSLHPIFNNNEIKQFSNLNSEHSMQLYSTLALNYKENLNKNSDNFSIIYCFNELDKGYLPPEFEDEDLQKIFLDKDTAHQNIRSIAEKSFGAFQRNILLFSNSIGISNKNIYKYLDLLSNESETIVIGKTIRENISFIGFNFINNNLIQDIHWNDLSFDNLLQAVNKYDVFVNIVNNSVIINNEKDFKILYDELSKKESWEYCGQKMHERFTHLFIEYKDLLK